MQGRYCVDCVVGSVHEMIVVFESMVGRMKRCLNIKSLSTSVACVKSWRPCEPHRLDPGSSSGAGGLDYDQFLTIVCTAPSPARCTVVSSQNARYDHRMI